MPELSVRDAGSTSWCIATRRRHRVGLSRVLTTEARMRSTATPDGGSIVELSNSRRCRRRVLLGRGGADTDRRRGLGPDANGPAS